MSWDCKPLSFQEVSKIGHWTIYVITKTSKSGWGGNERVSSTTSIWASVLNKKPLLTKLVGEGIRAEAIGGLGRVWEIATKANC